MGECAVACGVVGGKRLNCESFDVESASVACPPIRSANGSESTGGFDWAGADTAVGSVTVTAAGGGTGFVFGTVKLSD